MPRSIAKIAHRPKRGIAKAPHEIFFQAVQEALLPYQLEWVKDGARFRIWLKSRKVGASFTMALEAVMRCVFESRDQMIVSSGERTAQEVMEKCYRWLRVIVESGYKVKLKGHSKSEVVVDGCGKILSLAQNPDTVRGFHGDIFLDEAAHHSMDREIYKAAIPIATLGGRVSVASTPLGQSGLFYELWTDEARYKDYSRHRTDLNEAVAGGLDVDVEILKSNMDDESFRQEFLCEFVDEAVAFYTYELIRSCVGDTVEGTGPGYLGFDPGRRGDRAAICVLRELNGKLYTRNLTVLDKADFETQKAWIRGIVSEEGVVRGQIDAGGIGMQMAEELAKEFPFIVPVFFGQANKEDMAVSVKRRLETRTIQIPDDRDLIADIHAIRKSVTQGMRIRFDAPKTSRGHADRFWALALAVDAATQKQAIVEIY